MTGSIREPRRHDSAQEWWRTAVIYQIYPRSFADADGDGVGDLDGILDRLDYVRALGADAIWLSPIFRSPQADSGYDISDFRDIDPLFGTLADFDRLIERAHSLALRVIVDIVPNHTSVEHPWFRQAIAAGSGSAERGRYIFRDGVGPGQNRPPNNWQSLFSGPAWTRVVTSEGIPEQWYLHLFDSTQPDLDWENSGVLDEFDDVLRFWLDRGADGFRIDVARGLLKAPGLPDYPIAYQVAPAGGPDGTRSPMFDQHGIHDIFRRWRSILERYDGDRMLVAEAHVDPPSRLARYVRSDEMHQAFNFQYLNTAYSAEAIRAVIDESLAAFGAVGAPTTWVLNDHDDVRLRTRFGLDAAGGIDPALGLRCALVSTAVMLALPGSAYLYQGEELGLPEHLAIPDAARRDPTFARSSGRLLGRDGCRVPLPWTPDAPAFGFSTTGSSWLPQPADWGSLSVTAQEEDPTSTLWFYRTALRLRRRHGLGGAALRWNDSLEPDVLDFEVGTIRVVANLGTERVALPAGTIVLATSAMPEGIDVLAPDCAVWLA